MSLETVVFAQQVRTPHSEIWLADLSRSKKDAFAQIDIHYLPDGVEATVTFLRPLKTNELLHAFLDMIDDELISLGDQGRGNLRFRVISGGKIELFQRPDDDRLEVVDAEEVQDENP